MVLWGCPPPRGYLSVSSVPPEEHGIKRPVPHPPGGPLVGPAQPPVHLPNEGEGLLPQRVRDRAPVPVPGPGSLCPPRWLCPLPLCLRRRCRAPPPPRRGHPRRLRSRCGGGWLVLGSWGLGGDEIAGVRVNVVEVVVVVVVVVGVVCRHLLDAGGDAPHRLHVRLRGRPAPRPPLFRPPSPRAPMPRPACPSGPAAPLPLPLGPFPAPCPCRGSRPLSPTPWPARSPTVPRPAPCTWAPCPRPCAPFPCPGPFPAPCPESGRPLPALCPPPVCALAPCRACPGLLLARAPAHSPCRLLSPAPRSRGWHAALPARRPLLPGSRAGRPAVFAAAAA